MKHVKRRKPKAQSFFFEAKDQIAAEKENALRDIRHTVADLSIGIAEKVVRRQLSDDAAQQKLIERMLDDVCK